MQAVQTNDKATGLLYPEFSREGVLQSHLQSTRMSLACSRSHIPDLLFPGFLCSRIPRSPSSGALPWGCSGWRPWVLPSHRTVGGRGRSCGKKPNAHQTQHTLLSQQVHSLGDLCLWAALSSTGNLLISAEPNIYIAHSFITHGIFF